MIYRTLAAFCSIAAVLGGTAPKVGFQDNRVIEVMVPMQDGTKLHTVVAFPRSNTDPTKKYTAIVDRSPYGYGDLEWITDIFLPFGFVAIGQDMRGTEKSEGNFTMWASDAQDSRDLGDWITAQEWSDGKVFTFGASADGIGSLQTPKTGPAWLQSQYIAWATSEIYQILFPYGTYKQETAEQWLMGLTMPNPDWVYNDIATVRKNEMHSPGYWQLVELTDKDYAQVNYPNAFWGGWYDLFQLGTIQAFDGYNTKSNPAVRGQSVITMDPLGHCLDFADFFTENAVQGRTALVFGQLFQAYGIFPVQRSQIKNVTFYVMSSNDDAGKKAGQYWTSLDAFPTPKMTDFYLHADGSATMSPPTDSETASTTYKYDPANPVPTLGGCNLPDSIGGDIPCGPMDQTPSDARDDVLKFQTAPFSEEFPMTGGMFATIYVSSDAIDTDFMVKVSDVYPTGEARIINDNALRMRWRQDTLEPVYMEKGVVYKLEINIWNTSMVIAPGHSLRFTVTSSNWPRFSPNPNNGLLLADPNYPGTNITAMNTLYHSAQYPSKFTMPQVTKSQIPEVNVIKAMREMYPMLDDKFLAAQKKHIDRFALPRRLRNKKQA